MQFRTILFPYKKCVTEKRTSVKTLLIGSMPSLLTVFLSIPFNKLPWMYCIFFISICTYPYNSSGYHVDTYYHYQLHSISNVIMQIVILQNLNVRCTIWFIYVSSSHHSKSFLKKSPAVGSFSKTKLMIGLVLVCKIKLVICTYFIFN